MPSYRLGSTPLVHAPALIEWAINAYAFPRNRAVILRVVTETWPGLPEAHARLLLSRGLPYRLEHDTVILDIPEVGATADPAKTATRRATRSAREVGQ
jgi:hypothetical protein